MSMQIKLADGELESMRYNDMKRKSERYYEAWERVKETLFKTWTKKPDMWTFNLMYNRYLYVDDDVKGKKNLH